MSLLAAAQIHLALTFLGLCAMAQHEPFGMGCCMLAAWVEGNFPLPPASAVLLLGLQTVVVFSRVCFDLHDFEQSFRGWKVLFTTSQRKS